MTKATSILPTRDPERGFFGTMERAGKSAETAWTIASEELADALDARDSYAAAGIRNFLDSHLGSHFADMVAADIASVGSDDTTLRAAIQDAIVNHQRWSIDHQTARKEGIPVGLPFLTGWVKHYTITAGTGDP